MSQADFPSEINESKALRVISEEEAKRHMVSEQMNEIDRACMLLISGDRLQKMSVGVIVGSNASSLSKLGRLPKQSYQTYCRNAIISLNIYNGMNNCKHKQKLLSKL